MKLAITWKTAAEAMGGSLTSLNPEEMLDEFTTDSRLVKEGSVFWALRGKNRDAHEFLDDIARKGAAGAIIEHGRAKLFRKPPRHLIETADTLKALQRLSAWHRLRWKIPVAAVTGTNGKSTTKEMIKAILSVRGPACANAGNFNNQYGAPFSLLEMGPEHRSAVFELGASKQGDIQEIAQLVRPDAAVITCVGPAHLEFFGDLETVYRTKAEIAASLPPGGTLVYNADDPLLRRLDSQWRGRRITFGFGEADVRIAGEGGFALVHGGRRYEIPLELLRHDRHNAAAAASAALALGWNWEEIAQGLVSWKPLPMRMQTQTRGSLRLILDAYNANPVSMRAALDALSGGGNPRPRIAALGDMKELGAHSARYHAELGQWLAGADIDKIFLAGPEMKHCADALSAAGAGGKMRHAQTPQEWLEELRQAAGNGGTVLLKASRAMKFEEIMDKL
ncbi:MAG: UDP-N-acetylmuramoyl-tripeptide--D-alanyl-D-alanine ligase [Elusimicrobiales bacterium]